MSTLPPLLPILASGRIRRLLSIIFIAVIGLAASAQNRITIKDFTYDENEGTALTLAPKGVKDSNNQKCGLIVVHNVDLKGFSFKTGGWNKAENRSSGGKPVVNLWVSPGTKWIEVSNSDSSIKPSERYHFGQTVESEKTYHLYLGEVIKFNESGSQYVQVSVDAPNAIFFIDEQGDGTFLAWPLQDGKASKALRFGTYNYKVTAPDYHDEYGTFTVNDPDNTVTVNIKPRANFGRLTIPATDNLKGAQIIIDGTVAGNSSLNGYKLSSGTHTLQIQRPKYKVLVKEITIADNQTLTETPVLEQNFSRITIECADPEADIYLMTANNATKQATGTWMADLEPGSYVIETRRAGCKNGIKQITIAPGNQPQEFSVPAPEPTFGTVPVKSVPEGATIWLDGKEMGKTPKVLNNVLATTHSLKLTYPNYQDYTQQLDVKPGESLNVDAKMSNYVTVEISVEPRYASFYVDGKSSNNPYVYQGPPTYKNVRASAWRRKSLDKRIYLDHNEKISLSLPQVLLHEENQWYLEAGMQAGMMPLGVVVSTGFDLKWFNCQADFAYTFGPKKDIFIIEQSYDSYNNTTYLTNSAATFSADMTMGGRVGVNINCGGRVRITPQVGVSYVHMKVDEDNLYFGNPWALSCLGAVRCFIACTYNFGISITPEYLFAVNRSNGYKLLSETDSSFKNWANGFNCRVAAVINF